MMGGAMSADVRSWQPGSPWQILGDAEATNGAFLFGEARLEPGDPAPGLHVHSREDESLYVIEGVMTVELDGERIELRPGDFLILRRDIPHRFGNLGDQPVRGVGVIAPTGIEGMFSEQATYFSTLTGPPDPAKIAEIGARYGVTHLGPPLSRD
jgi:mannose-6-phosphate isomerase-like protein (cupin superfamily)